MYKKRHSLTSVSVFVALLALVLGDAPDLLPLDTRPVEASYVVAGGRFVMVGYAVSASPVVVR